MFVLNVLELATWYSVLAMVFEQQSGAYVGKNEDWPSIFG